MARRVNPAEGKAETADHDEQTPMTGGSPGVPPAASSPAPLSGQISAGARQAPDPDAPPPPEVKQYMVEGMHPDGKKVLYAGYPVLFRNGKVVDDANFDVEGLRKQGVRLRPLG